MTGNSDFDGRADPRTRTLVWSPADGGESNLNLPARGRRRPHFTHDKNAFMFIRRRVLVSLPMTGRPRTHIQLKGRGYFYAEEPVAADDVPAISTDSGYWPISAISSTWLADVPR